jgi:hypothetical protein
LDGTQQEIGISYDFMGYFNDWLVVWNSLWPKDLPAIGEAALANSLGG